MKNIDPLMTALELLDVDYPDPFVRFSAVRLLDTRIDDDRLLPVILQIVQVSVKRDNGLNEDLSFALGG